MTFDELCEKWAVTERERVEAAWFLAMQRARATVDMLLGGRTARRNRRASPAVPEEGPGHEG